MIQYMQLPETPCAPRACCRSLQPSAPQNPRPAHLCNAGGRAAMQARWPLRQIVIHLRHGQGSGRSQLIMVRHQPEGALDAGGAYITLWIQ